MSKAEDTDREEVIRELYGMGYINVPVISTPGEISIRGGILDIFSPDSEYPVRVEFFGDEIESLRYFDVDTQLSVKEIEEIWICPAIEPKEGPDLIELLPGHRLILYEPDNIRRRFQDLDQLLGDGKTVSFTSLPIEGEGYHCRVNSIAGMGLLRDERKTIEDFIAQVNILRKTSFIVMACSSERQAKRLKDLFAEQNSDVALSAGHILNETYSPLTGTKIINLDLYAQIPHLGEQIAGELAFFQDGTLGDLEL